MAQVNEQVAFSDKNSEFSSWAVRLNELSAAHFLSKEFKKDVADPKLAENYKKAYDFHMSEANRYKEILNEIAKSITTDLDKTTVSYDKDMAEHMK